MTKLEWESLRIEVPELPAWGLVCHIPNTLAMVTTEQVLAAVAAMVITGEPIGNSVHGALNLADRLFDYYDSQEVEST